MLPDRQKPNTLRTWLNNHISAIDLILACHDQLMGESINTHIQACLKNINYLCFDIQKEEMAYMFKNLHTVVITVRLDLICYGVS